MVNGVRVPIPEEDWKPRTEIIAETKEPRVKKKKGEEEATPTRKNEVLPDKGSSEEPHVVEEHKEDGVKELTEVTREPHFSEPEGPDESHVVSFLLERDRPHVEEKEVAEPGSLCQSSLYVNACKPEAKTLSDLSLIHI